MKKVGVVVPTIFSRPQYLPLALRSIRSAGNAFILLSTPEPTAENVLLLEKLKAESLIDDHLIETPGLPLAGKLNEAMLALPESCELIGWLGDDDLLTFKALELASVELDRNKSAVMVYGGIDYINPDGRVIFTNASSQFHERLLRFGPQLIPQPGSLWRRSAFEDVGGLSSEFNLAFDFDLFRKLGKVGRLIHLPITLAQFRWHPDSLSVKRRWISVSEASRVRRLHYKGILKLLWPIWEPWVMLATWLAGKLVTLRARRLS